MPATLEHLIFDVSDMQASEAFYQGVLGLEVLEKEEWEDYAIVVFDMGGTTLLLMQQPEGEREQFADKGGGLVIKMQTDDINQVFESAKRAGAMVLQEIEEGDGELTMLLGDPDGFALLVCQTTG